MLHMRWSNSSKLLLHAIYILRRIVNTIICISLLHALSLDSSLTYSLLRAYFWLAELFRARNTTPKPPATTQYNHVCAAPSSVRPSGMVSWPLQCNNALHHSRGGLHCNCTIIQQNLEVMTHVSQSLSSASCYYVLQ